MKRWRKTGQGIRKRQGLRELYFILLTLRASWPLSPEQFDSYICKRKLDEITVPPAYFTPSSFNRPVISNGRALSVAENVYEIVGDQNRNIF
jgi:hypothetical protein